MPICKLSQSDIQSILYRAPQGARYFYMSMEIPLKRSLRGMKACKCLRWLRKVQRYLHIGSRIAGQRVFVEDDLGIVLTSAAGDIRNAGARHQIAGRYTL